MARIMRPVPFLVALWCFACGLSDDATSTPDGGLTGATGGQAGAGAGDFGGAPGGTSADAGSEPEGQGGLGASGGKAGTAGSSAGGAGASGGDATGCDLTHDDCDGLPANGCEADLVIDKENCGNCGHVCVAPPQQHCPYYGTCVLGSCVVSGGEPGWEDCNCSLADGAETNIMDSHDACGSCDHACEPTEACMAGTCAPDDGGAG